jgi:hypothetical protein
MIEEKAPPTRRQKFTLLLVCVGFVFVFLAVVLFLTPILLDFMAESVANNPTVTGLVLITGMSLVIGHGLYRRVSEWLEEIREEESTDNA